MVIAHTTQLVLTTHTHSNNLFEFVQKGLDGPFCLAVYYVYAVEADRIARASKTPGNGFDSRQLHHNIKGINYET